VAKEPLDLCMEVLALSGVAVINILCKSAL